MFECSVPTCSIDFSCIVLHIDDNPYVFSEYNLAKSVVLSVEAQRSLSQINVNNILFTYYLLLLQFYCMSWT